MSSLLPPVVTGIPTINMEPLSLEELLGAIANIKSRKAPGPDDVPIELFKEMGVHLVYPYLDLLNEWFTTAFIPREGLLARVAPIYKKGDSSQYANYRPTSLLSTLYKLFKKILKRRLADAIDRLLQPSGKHVHLLRSCFYQTPY